MEGGYVMSGRRGIISILLVIIVALAFLTASCGEGEEATSTPMTLYESTEHGFSIEYPEGWTESAQELGALFALACTNPEETLYAAISIEFPARG